MGKIISTIKSCRLNLFIKNFINLFRWGIIQELTKIQLELKNTQLKMIAIQQDIIFYKILNYFNIHPSQEFKKEISYLSEIGQIAVFPYRKIKRIENVIAGFDENKRMPYVIHYNNKRLYFPKSWDVNKARTTYISYIEDENILGGNYSEKAPHQYQTENFRVLKEDIVLDIGSAEALFALDVVDIAKKVFIFEPQERWIEPLNATFERYKDKVVIINKFVSSKNSKTEIRLETILKNENIKNLFIKMDIEGFETLVLQDNKEFLKRNIDIRVACCTYHKQSDAESLKVFFNEIGYKTEYSDGYMVFIYDENIQAPYFRRGIIRCQRIFN